MFPIRDHKQSHKRPLAVYALIAANAAVFLLQLTTPNLDAFIGSYALTPALIDFGNIATLTPFVTSMFLHGGWFHLLSNMWFLWIFGDNIEAAFHHTGFIGLYLLAGFSGSLLQFIIAPSLPIPMLGASGAIAGVLGAYLLLYPRAKIESVVFYFGFLSRVNIPAQFMLLYWFITQLFSGVGSVATGALAAGGVAWFAHIGGFVVGYAVVRAVKKRRRWYQIA